MFYFLLTFYDGYNVFDSYKQDFIDKFINKLTKNSNNFCIIPLDFIKIGNWSYNKEELKKVT